MKQFHIAVVSILLLSSSAHAQFTRAYAPAQWTTTNSSGSNGTVNSAGAPGSISVTGSDGGSGSNVTISYTRASIATGVWSFSWSYHSNDDGPNYDPAYVIIGGTAVKLTNDVGANDQSGIYTGASVGTGTSIGFRVLSTDNVGGNATITITSFSPPAGILPVKLISFTAAMVNKEVKLECRTAGEINNSRFEVERSFDNKDFVTVSSIKAIGNTNTVQKYNSYDKAPSAGINYYRLRQIDVDGNFSYSHVVAIRPAYHNATQVYPNPAQNNTTLQWETLTAHKEEVILYNAAGRPVQTRILDLAAGVNRVTWNVSTLAAGLYYFKLEETTIPFVIKH